MPAPVVAAIAGAASLGSAAIGAYGANKAAKAQKDAAKQMAKTQQQTLSAQEAMVGPYVEAGKNALAEYQKLAPYQSFGMAQFQADPGYQFRMSEGIKALERSAAALPSVAAPAIAAVTGSGMRETPSDIRAASRRIGA